MNNKTDKYFSDRLGHFEQAPPGALWDQIASKIESRRKRKALMIILRIAAGMAILLSTGIGIYMMNKKENPDIHAAASAPLANQDSEQKTPDSHRDANVLSSGDAPDEIEATSNSGNTTNYKETGEEAANDGKDDELFLAGEDVTESDMLTDDIAEFLIEDNELLPGIPKPDSILISKSLPDQLAGTQMTPEEAAAALLAQLKTDEDIQSGRKRNWIVGSEIAPLYSDRSIASPGYDNASDYINSSESGILAYAAGIRVGTNTGKRFTIQSGIYYSRYGQEINQVVTVPTAETESNNYNFIAASNSTGTISGIIDIKKDQSGSYRAAFYDVFGQNDYTNGVVNSNIKPLVPADAEDVRLLQYFNYFEVPLLVKYKLIDRKLDFSFSGGVITNFLVGNTVNVISDGEKTKVGKTLDIKNINYVGSVGMGLEFPVINNFSLTLEPRFRYYINPIDRTDYISVHPYSFGFFAGMNYRF